MVCVATDVVWGGGAAGGIAVPRSCEFVRTCPGPSIEAGRLFRVGEEVPASPGPRDVRFPSPTKVVMKLSNSCRSFARATGGEAAFKRQSQCFC